MLGLILNLNNLAVTQQSEYLGELGKFEDRLVVLQSDNLKATSSNGADAMFEFVIDMGVHCRIRTIYISGEADGDISLTISNYVKTGVSQTVSIRNLIKGQLYRLVASRVLDRSRFWKFYFTSTNNIKMSIDSIKLVPIPTGDYHR